MEIRVIGMQIGNVAQEVYNTEKGMLEYVDDNGEVFEVFLPLLDDEVNLDEDYSYLLKHFTNYLNKARNIHNYNNNYPTIMGCVFIQDNYYLMGEINADNEVPFYSFNLKTMEVITTLIGDVSY